MDTLSSQTKTRQRIRSIDIVRGLVMVIMCLDHTRDLYHTAFTQNPLDLNTTTPWFFFTRWITHLCAPIFVFLSGASAYLSYKLHNNPRESRLDLLKRGIWLIILELTLVNFALWFDLQFRIILLQVIAAIGIGLIVISFLLKVNPVKIAVAALIIIFAHNLLQNAVRPSNQSLNFLYNLLLAPGLRNFPSGFILFIAYPWVQWVAIMMLGFACGRIFEQDWDKQKRTLVNLGLLFLAMFILLRAFNFYGDPAPWQSRDNFFFTFMSFINVTKYPPSLLFDLLFLGIMFLLLRFSVNLPKGIQNFFSVYGKVPLFYYMLHLYFIRIGVFIIVFAQGYKMKDLLFGPFQFGRPANWGLRLLLVYVVWIIIILALYPLCKWWGKVKERNRGQWWIKYV